MSEILTLRAELRDRAGKGAARATRRAGRVPAVIYGDGKEPVLISLEPRSLTRELHKSGFFARLADLDVGGTMHRTLPRDVQYHPVTDAPLHVDFLRVGASTRITVAVPVVFINQDRSPGLRRGGILNVVRHEIEMHCGADNIPDRIVVDLDGVEINSSIHISAVTLPAGASPTITDRDFTIATVVAPSTKDDAVAEGTAAS